MTRKTYEINLKCKNCGKRDTKFLIPKGITIEAYGKKEKPLCKNCGCESIKH